MSTSQSPGIQVCWLDKVVPHPFSFELPAELEAGEPPEARGLRRDDVRLMVSHYRDDAIVHTGFRNMADHLRVGDLLVINTSGTLPAALNATRENGMPVEVHLSTHLPADLWLVELRLPANGTRLASQPFFGAVAGEIIKLQGCGSLRLLTPYLSDRQTSHGNAARLWVVELRLTLPVNEYLMAHGFPIRYGYVRQQWPIAYYQTVYATEPGSAEMPSAGRAFTPELITQLVARGVMIAPLLLHTGVASLESNEPPYEEFYRVPANTARLINHTRIHGGRVIAVGTTVVRALETVADTEGVAHPGEGWTRLVIAPERGVRVVDGLLTGFHEPHATHLMMLEAIAGRRHLHATYSAALHERYLWHEFGDLHLILP